MATRRYQFSLQQWNGPQLANRIPTIMARFRAVIDKQFKEDIQDVQFDWTGKATRRRNGEIAGNPRNIVDTGAFLRSQRADTTSQGGRTEIIFTWGNEAVDYAGIILQGRRNDPSYPARDWIAVALKKKPFEQFFATEWRRLERRSL
jgi:hypothetical protein